MEKTLTKKGIATDPMPFTPTHVSFVSNFLKQEYVTAGIEFESSDVVYGGVSVERFLFQRENSVRMGGSLRLLYVGQVTRDRGLHSAIEELKFLCPESRSKISLTVVGDSLETRYKDDLFEQARNPRLSQQILFEGKMSQDEMPRIYRQHDILVMPSLRKEGLPFTMMEAMLSGCAVVTTGSGGAMEIAQLADLPLFPKGDAQALSRILEGLICNRKKLEQIAKRG